MLPRSLNTVRLSFTSITLLLLLSLFLPAVAQAGLYPVIDQPLYGAKLGERHSILSRDIRKIGKQITRAHNIKNKVHSHGKVWSIRGSLSKHKGIDHTRFYMLGGQIYEIEVVFKSHSNRKFKKIKNTLIDTYGEYKVDATGGALFAARIDGQLVTIRLHRAIAPNTKKYNTTLQYFYKRFIRDVRIMHKRKMSRNHQNSTTSVSSK